MVVANTGLSSTWHTGGKRACRCRRQAGKAARQLEQPGGLETPKPPWALSAPPQQGTAAPPRSLTWARRRRNCLYSTPGGWSATPGISGRRRATLTHTLQGSGVVHIHGKSGKAGGQGTAVTTRVAATRECCCDGGKATALLPTYTTCRNYNWSTAHNLLQPAAPAVCGAAQPLRHAVCVQPTGAGAIHVEQLWQRSTRTSSAKVECTAGPNGARRFAGAAAFLQVVHIKHTWPAERQHSRPTPQAPRPQIPKHPPRLPAGCRRLRQGTP